MKRILLSILVMGFVLLSACGAPATAPLPEAPPTPPPTEQPAPLPSPPQEKPPTNIIKDLAYMKAAATLYSDDADPEWEGSEVSLLWYDSKSNLIFTTKYKDIVLHLSIEILASKIGEFPSRFTERVYKDELQITFPFHIRIPFEHINADPQTHKSLGIANIVVQTPQQGNFSIEHGESPYGDIFLYSPEMSPK